MKLNKQKVYDLLKTVPKGKVTTYASLARALHTKAYRAIGQIIRQNPNAPQVPCHRVIQSNGMLGGYMGHTSNRFVAKKRKHLLREGVQFKKDKVAEFNHVFFEVS